MKIPIVFLDHKKRNLILWFTDILVAFASYFYMTRPEYIQRLLQGLDLVTLRPDLDPEVLASPEFFDLIQRMVMVVSILTVAIVVLLHTWVFYRCYLRKKAAIAYVKVYSFLAAFSLLMWLFYNFHYQNFWILVPTAIYVLVFLTEKQPTVKT